MNAYLKTFVLLVGLSCGGNIVTLHAALIAEDSFDYPVGNLARNNGGTGWTGVWGLGGNSVSTPGRTYSDSNFNLKTAGNALTFTGANGNSPRRVSSTHGTAGETVYISFIAQASAGDYAGVNLYNGTSLRMFLGKPIGSANWGIDPTGPGTFVSAKPASTASFLVFRLSYTAANTTIRLYVNPSLAAEPATSDIGDVVRSGLIDFNTIEPQAGILAVDAGMDELRIGSTYADVTPHSSGSGLPVLFVSDVAISEPVSGTGDAVFNVTLSEASTRPVTVDYATTDGTAKSGLDYITAVGTLIFAPGETNKTIKVAVKSDPEDDPNEIFSVKLSNASNAVIGDAEGTGTILKSGLPTLEYSAYFGGSGDEKNVRVAVDPAGNIYLAGTTTSTNFPLVKALQPALAGTVGAPDIFILKLDPSGSNVIYSTYLGGSGTETLNTIAVDDAGELTLVGTTTSTNFPTVNAYRSNPIAGANSYVAKIKTDGSALAFSTYFPGIIYGVTTDPAGTKVCLCGDAFLPVGFPLVNPLRTTYLAGEGMLACFDIVQPSAAPAAVALSGVHQNPSVSMNLVFSSYLGGDRLDVAYALARDHDGNLLVAGQTQSTGLATSGSRQTTLSGQTDVFVTKITPDYKLAWTTYLGGSGFEIPAAIAVDASGNAYVTGSTRSTDFPRTAGAFQTTFGGGSIIGGVPAFSDAFVTKISADGKSFAYSTYVGGDNQDDAYAIAVDGQNRANLVGRTESTNFPVKDELFGLQLSAINAFVAVLNSTGTELEFSSRLNQSAGDGGATGVALGEALPGDNPTGLRLASLQFKLPDKVKKHRRIYASGDQRRTGSFSESNDAFLIVAEMIDASVPVPPDSDFGDAPASYKTLLADNGARHKLVADGPYIGSKPDAEYDGQPGENAVGDDLNGSDDENGVVFNGRLIQAGELRTIGIIAPAGGKLDIWIDYNRDGHFDDSPNSPEYINKSIEGHPTGGSFSLNKTSVTQEIRFRVPGNTSDGASFARFRISTAGTPLATGAAEDGEVEDEGVVLINPNANHPPVLQPITKQTVNEGTVLSLAATATDPDLGQSRTFTLDGAPAGASITPAGMFTWTPTEEQGPGAYSILVRVTDNGDPNLSDTKSFIVEVLEVNSPPVIAPIPNQSLTAGQEWTFQVPATDPDRPANKLTYGLDPGAPSGATITSTTGIITWTPTGAQTGTHTIKGTVTDGVPPEIKIPFEFTVTVVGPTAKFDYGDAPDFSASALGAYPTTLTRNGARHVLVTGGPILGAVVDADNDGQPSADAAGDGADEDGVTFLTPLIQGTVARIRVVASKAAKLDAWIDFNGAFGFADLDDYIFRSLAVNAGENILAFTVPVNAKPGETYARFRISTEGGLPPFGQAGDGEVEDYRVTLIQAAAVQFDRANYDVAEGEFAHTLVVRTGDTNAGVEVDCLAIPASAQAGLDFAVPIRTHLLFFPGETAKTVSVETLRDAIPEPSEVLVLVLANAVGAQIADPSATVVEIRANGGSLPARTTISITHTGSGVSIERNGPSDSWWQFTDILSKDWKILIGAGKKILLSPDEQNSIFKDLIETSVNYFRTVDTVPFGTIKGTVYDPDGNRLPGLVLEIGESGKLTTTDSQGRFTLTDVPTDPKSTVPLSFKAYVKVTDPETGMVEYVLIQAIADVDLLPGGPIDMNIKLDLPKDAMKPKKIPLAPPCKCIPFCYILSYSVDGGAQTVVAFGGVLGDCKDEPPRVVITGPGGVNVNNPKRGRQKFPKAANGTWTVISTVCGQTETRKITLP